MLPDQVLNPGPLTYESGVYRLRYAARLYLVLYMKHCYLLTKNVGKFCSYKAPHIFSAKIFAHLTFNSVPKDLTILRT